MNAERRTRLEEAGIDVGEALERMLGSEALLERLLGKFPADPNFAALCEALAEGDAQRAVAAAHTLKGVCANLSMTGLHSLFTRQVEALRGGDMSAAAQLMEQIAPAMATVTAAIGDGDGER